MIRFFLIGLLLIGLLGGTPLAGADAPFIDGREHVVWSFETET